jgi:hypothetical protein
LKFKHIEYENENGNLIMFYHSDKSEQFWLMEVISKLNFLLIVYFNEALPEQMAKAKMRLRHYYFLDNTTQQRQRFATTFIKVKRI